MIDQINHFIILTVSQLRNSEQSSINQKSNDPNSLGLPATLWIYVIFLCI